MVAKSWLPKAVGKVAFGKLLGKRSIGKLMSPRVRHAALLAKAVVALERRRRRRRRQQGGTATGQGTRTCSSCTSCDSSGGVLPQKSETAEHSASELQPEPTTNAARRREQPPLGFQGWSRSFRSTPQATHKLCVHAWRVCACVRVCAKDSLPVVNARSADT